MKKCSKCGLEKELSEFSNNKNNKDNKHAWCKNCNKRYKKQFFINNKETILEKYKQYYLYNKENILEQKKQYYLYNKENILEKCKQYRKNNIEKILKRDRKRDRQYRQSPKAKELRKKKFKQRIKNDPCFRCHRVISSSIRKTLKSQGGIKNAPIFSKLPYTPEELVKHIESLWEPWMNWDNHGRLSFTKQTWQIDHIIPQSKLPYDSMEHENFLKCWTLENLRPLESIENIRKGDKIDG